MLINQSQFGSALIKLAIVHLMLLFPAKGFPGQLLFAISVIFSLVIYLILPI